MNQVKLNWITPDAESWLAYQARVSNLKADFEPRPNLIKSFFKRKEWSPLEMVNASCEIFTSRAIARQIIRHRSFAFQEYSGRYSVYENLGQEFLECRLQHESDRQRSVPCENQELADWWEEAQRSLTSHAGELYAEAIDRGIAREQARGVLPEGLTPTHMHMNGTLRSWVHYWEVRCDDKTQKEHRLIAEQTRALILPHFPSIREALSDGV